MQPSSFNKAMSCALDKVGNSRMALKDEQQMTLQNVYTARMFFFSIIVYAVFLVCMVTDRYGGIYGSYRLYSCLASTLKRHKRLIAIANVQATFLHSCTLPSYVLPNNLFLRVIICKFGLCISMNYTESVAELLAHARTVHTAGVLGIFIDLFFRYILYTVSLCRGNYNLYQALLSDLCRAPGNEAILC